MALSELKADVALNIGDVLTGARGTYGRKLVSYVYIEEIGQYRWLAASVSVSNNKATDGSDISIYTSAELRSSFPFRWTKNPSVVIEKGDAFKDDSGNYYIAESATKVWRLSSGTWSKPRIKADGVITWYNDVVLTPVEQAAGGKFSKIFK